MEYNPSNIKAPWGRTMGDLEATFRQWGVKQWQVRPLREPDHRDHSWTPSDPATVTITWLDKQGEEVTMTLGKHPYYYQNLRVLFFAVEALRTNEMRGLTDVIKQAYGLLEAPKTLDPYQVLMIHPSASKDDIKAAYRRLAHEHHPDRGGDAGRFREINEAYERLTKGE